MFEESKHLHYEAGFELIRVTSGLVLPFPHYCGSSFVTGVYRHGSFYSRLDINRNQIATTEQSILWKIGTSFPEDLDLGVQTVRGSKKVFNGI